MYYKFFVLFILLIPTSIYAGDKAIMGSLFGAGIGAVIGHSADRTGGAGKGAAIGAIGGYLIGQQLDKNKPLSTPASKQTFEYDCQKALSDTDNAANIHSTRQKVFLLQNALRICPSNARIHNDLGVAYYQRGQRYDHQRARLELQEALRIEPSYRIAQQNLRNM